MKRRGAYTILFMILVFILVSFSEAKIPFRSNDKFVVVLDAGHGGHDPGNLGNGYLEKHIALKIVLKVGEILEKNPDIKVIYTREDDTFIDLFKRGEIANKANADLFVSVHCDSHGSDAHGAGTFVLGLHANKQNFEIAKKENSVIYLEDDYEAKYAKYNINSPESIIGLTIMQEEFLDQSIQLAKMMQDKFSKKLKRTDRKVKQAGFIVLHQTFMPSVLVETGFLTNKDEGKYLNSSKGQLEMGTAIAQAVLDYKKTIPAGTTKTNKVVETPEVKTPKVEIKEPVKKKVEIVKETPPVVEEKKPEPSTPKKEVATKSTVKSEPNDRLSKPNLVFKVQLFASSKDIPLNANDFKGLNKLSKEPVKNLFRYMYGNASTYFDAKLLKSNADVKGYTTSYVVAYKDGKRISLSEALKYVAE